MLLSLWCISNCQMGRIEANNTDGDPFCIGERSGFSSWDAHTSGPQISQRVLQFLAKTFETINFLLDQLVTGLPDAGLQLNGRKSVSQAWTPYGEPFQGAGATLYIRCMLIGSKDLKMY